MITVEVSSYVEDRLKFLAKFDYFNPNDFMRLPKDNDKIVDFVKYQLYEFNEHYGKELAELYNPLDKDQQMRFSVFITTHLSAKFSEVGLRLADARFELP